MTEIITQKKKQAEKTRWVIHTLGGGVILSKRLGISNYNINNWTKRGRIPPHYLPEISRMLKETANRLKNFDVMELI